MYENHFEKSLSFFAIIYLNACKFFHPIFNMQKEITDKFSEEKPIRTGFNISLILILMFIFNL